VYLEKLKLFGFKSFAKKTELKLLPGITAIVGPNGCGKSNIADAIRWVLGEQKAGTLRSDKMESVIFNGAKNTKPLGMAEVSLVIQNSNHLLPVEYSEVVITRRLFRSGESQYLLNNNPCRLKDLNDLLMDTGLAPDAYSIIELRMVEEILNGKPEDRRRIFEEAVGLSKYKQRRKLTFRKLDATEQDLLRIADIIGEVRSKVNSLHRQVRRAQRYQTLAKNLQQAEIRVASHHFSQINQELGPLTKNFEEASRNRESISSQISFKEAEVEAIQTQLIDNEDQYRNGQNRLNELTQKIQKSEKEILLSRERLKALAENKNRLCEESQNLKHRISTIKKQLLETQAQKTTTKEEIARLQNEFDQEKESLHQLDQLLNEKRQIVRENEQTVLSLMQAVSEKQRLVDRLKDQLTQLKQREQGLRQDKERQLVQIEQDTKLHQRLSHDLEQQQDKLEQLIEDQTVSELESEKLGETIDQLKTAILKMNNQIESVQQRIAFLKELLESYADYPEGVQYLMLEQGSDNGLRGTLADVLSVDEANRKAIEAALGDAATYLLVTREDDAYLGISALKDRRKGVVTFLPVDRIPASSEARPLPKNDGVIGWADQLVRCEDQFLPAVRILLGAFLVVEDDSTARRLRDIYSESGIHIVTKNGEIFYNWGGIKGGVKDTDSESLIGRQDQLTRLGQTVETQYHHLDQLQEQLKTNEVKKSAILNQIAVVSQNIKNRQQDISQKQVEISQVEYRLQQSKQVNVQIENQLKTLSEEASKIHDQIQSVEPEVTEISQQQTLANQEIKQWQQQLQQLEDERNSQAEKVNQLNIKIVEITGAERNLNLASEQNEKLIEEYQITIQKQQQQVAEIENQQQQLQSRIDELGELLAIEYTEKEKHDKDVAEIAQKSRGLRDAIDAKSKDIKTIRDQREAIAEKLHKAELRISELRIKADNLYRRIFEEYDVELKRLPLDPDYDVSVDQVEIEKIKERIKRLGPVNLLALKEYEKEKERLDFLEKQQEDLITAEQNLKDTIDHINQNAQEKFTVVFQEIRRNFLKVFKDFFPTGQADLVITGDADPLEADIEIIANPKGKQMESLSLLSGGEKALTAISLLFGIYLVKPSPVCILDEVDAPLDDNNVKRFISTLKQFSNSTQFLMVTHNKLTMKAANSLYGITMEESGVSKVVSVKLE